ncbi:MAG: M14 family metallopeptidase [Bacteroidales bacterium]
MKNILFYALLLFAVHFSYAQSPDWITYYEKSDSTETPRYEETIEYCKKLAEGSEWIEYTTFGASPQNRDLPLLILDKSGNFEPSAVHDGDNVIILVEACIHPGEPDGKDAGLMLLRDLAIKKEKPDILDNLTLLFIPILNVDGHERFGPYNRINQNGPKEMGWRTNAQNLNLNRDFLKADAPEIQHWLRLFNKWMPDFFIDIHTTDGADYQYPLTYAMEVFGNMEENLSEWQKETYLKKLKTDMRATGHPIFPYVSLKEWHNPESGIVAWLGEPRLSQGYTAIRNRPGLLVETHMLKDYKTRVSATYELLKHTFKILDKEKDQLKQLVRNADKKTASDDFREKQFPVDFENTSDSTMIDFEGIEYSVKESELTGAKWFQYGNKPVTFEVPYFNEIIPAQKVTLPEYYIIPPEWTEVIKRIKLHGIETHKIHKEIELNDVTTYKFSNVQWSTEPFEGRHRIQNFEMDTLNKTRKFPKGSVVIDMNQNTAKVIAHILEPVAPDSYLKWGFFNAIFEQKEYAEMYVMEKKAREMLDTSEQIREEFERKKKEDKEFTNNPWAMLNWFYKKTPYWDEKKNVYPVGKITEQESVKVLQEYL